MSIMVYLIELMQNRRLIKMSHWLETHIDIWYKILTDKEKDSDAKVECLTNLVRLVKEEKVTKKQNKKALEKGSKQTYGKRGRELKEKGDKLLKKAEEVLGVSRRQI